MYASVVTLRPLQNELYYKIPENIGALNVGSRVIVPLGRSKEVAFIRSFFNNLPEECKAFKIKEISEVLEIDSLIDEEFFKLVYWIRDYYFYPLGEILKRSIPNHLSKKKPINIEKRLKIIENSSNKKSNIKVNKVETLNENQNNAVKEILEGEGGTFLLHGVTGSGKTEVYIEVIKSSIKKGENALVLVPEIALTPQLIARFEAHFGLELAKFHSGLTEVQRLHEWLKVKFGKVKIAIGVRSAIFLPFNKLGVIIIDEEHENTFKQDDRLKYNARDIAILRGKMSQAKVVLGSATPSLESYFRSTSIYKLIQLRNKAAQAVSPKISIVDLKYKNEMYKDTYFTNTLFNALKENLIRGQQSLLFLNRTGYSNFVICKECGETVKCPNCSISLIYYKGIKSFKCSYCDFLKDLPKRCPSCDSSKVEMIGAGTERIEEDLQKFLPAAKVVRMDRDTVQKRGSRERIIEDISNEKIDILVGTQMIAKGLDFHKITLVGVIVADTILSMPDFKSSEKTFQLLAQVSGRSGRGLYPGQVIIQTYNPDHYAIKYVDGEDYESFYSKEIVLRKELNYPPFSRLISIKISGNVENKVKEKSSIIAGQLRSYIKTNKKWRDNISLLGPAPQILYIVRNKFRYHILLKTKSPALSNALLKTFIKQYGSYLSTGGVKVSFDIDPVNMM